MGPRRVLVLMVLAGWLLLGPIAMAFESCDGMCEGPCGALCALASVAPGETTLELLSDLTLPVRSDLPGILVQVLDPPPKAAPLFA
jgi:hypothetical protein